MSSNKRQLIEKTLGPKQPRHVLWVYDKDYKELRKLKAETGQPMVKIVHALIKYYLDDQG